MNYKKLKRILQKQNITLTHDELNKVKLDATSKATQITNLIPLLILRDKFGFGRVRLNRYLEYFNETLDSFNKGYLNLKDIEKVLEDEVGLKFIWEK